MKQNSTKNMIIRHLKDIKAKIEQKSINNIKLPFEGPFNDKFAGRTHLISELRQTCSISDDDLLFPSFDECEG